MACFQREKAIRNKINSFSSGIYSIKVWKDSKTGISILILTDGETES